MNKDYYTNGEKEFLLKVARTTLEKFLRTGEKYEPKTVNQKLWEKYGVFVSLHTTEGQLRGCIGTIQPVESLIVGVRDNTLSAAHDSRFTRLEESELENINIEISILTEPEKTTVGEIKAGDGVIIKKGASSATYLPQVWDDLKDKDKFFSSLCQKAGLDESCYQDSATEFYKYHAIVFSEAK